MASAAEERRIMFGEIEALWRRRKRLGREVGTS